MVISRHGKANLHSERVGSPVPKEKRVLAEAHPASAAQLSRVFRSAIFCAKPSDNLNFHHPSEANLFTAGCRCPCDVARTRLSFTLPSWPPNPLVVFLFPFQTHATTKPSASYETIHPPTSSIQSTLILHIEDPTRQELRSDNLHWGSLRQTLRRLLGREG